MSTTVATLAATLHTLFTSTAELLGRVTGFIQRQRALTAADFAQTLVFGWIDDPKATFESFAVRLDLSAQALQQRLSPQARAFVQALLERALQFIWAARPTTFRLLQRFGAIVVEDTTCIALPADLATEFRGQGGSDASAGQAMLKVLIRWELLTGQLLALQWVPGVTNDATLAATAADLPVRALHLADQGFFDAGRWQPFGADQFWISRVPASIAVAVTGAWQGLADWLQQLPSDAFDGAAVLVQRQGLACRLTARRCPPEVAARRRQKLRDYTRSKKGREPSQRQLVLCDWLVLATNVPAATLTAVELWVVYRCRWQIELLFKRGKQQLGWTFSHGHSGQRVLVEVLAKLLGFVVVHWVSLLRGGPLAGISVTKLFRLIRRFALSLLEYLTNGASVQTVLEKLAQELERLRPQPKRKKNPSTRQFLLDPTLAL